MLFRSTIGYQIIPDSTQTLPTTGYASSVARPIHDGESLAIEVVATDVGTISGSPTLTVTATGDIAPRTVTLVEGTAASGTRVWRGSFDAPHGTRAYDGQATVEPTVSGITDAAGNAASVASGQSIAFIIDSTPPSVAIAYQVTDRTTAARVVLDIDRLAELLGHLVPEHPADDVRAAAWGGADHDAKRLVRPALLGAGRKRRSGSEGGGKAAHGGPSADFHFRHSLERRLHCHNPPPAGKPPQRRAPMQEARPDRGCQSPILRGK